MNPIISMRASPEIDIILGMYAASGKKTIVQSETANLTVGLNSESRASLSSERIKQDNSNHGC
ncbi:MAG TPA: hypothetical protein VHJ19_06570 [Gammaproteobacteria bacterium]|nr:hypothetical protein [Gammaproteobacteria bacterium]